MHEIYEMYAANRQWTEAIKADIPALAIPGMLRTTINRADMTEMLRRKCDNERFRSAGVAPCIIHPLRPGSQVESLRDLTFGNRKLKSSTSMKVAEG